MSKQRKIVLAFVELNRLLPHNFRVTDCRPDEARHLKSSGSVYKIDLKNKIFSLYLAVKSLLHISLFLVKKA